MTKLPESPMFLLVQGKHDETIDCLKTVYRWNNKSDDKFPVSMPICLVQYLHIYISANNYYKTNVQRYLHNRISRSYRCFIGDLSTADDAGPYGRQTE